LPPVALSPSVRIKVGIRWSKRLDVVGLT
jgi:hypothetical protein